MYRVLLIIIATLFITTHANAEDKAKSFFFNFIVLGQTFDTKVADLYSDNALIHSHRIYPNGETRKIKLSGAEWKQLVIQVMPLAKEQNGKNIYSNIDITKIKNGFRVTAGRYSTINCHKDNSYYMVIKKDEKGSLLIVEEFKVTQEQSNC